MDYKRVFPFLLAFVLLPWSAFCAELHAPVNPKTLQVEREFALFASDWIEKINRNYAFRQDNIEIIPQKNFYIGRYSAVQKDSVLWSVKKVSNSPLTYLGFLEYLEWTFESTAQTHEQAALGPFTPVKGRKVTEIFRYGHNKWLE